MNENPGMKRQPRRRSMQLKLNALVIGNILAVALGLMAISYYVFCQRVDDKYYSSLDRAAVACANNIAPEVIKFFWDSVNTDEFREVRDRAEKADNEQIIKDWLESKPGWDYTYYYEEQDFLDGDEFQNDEETAAYDEGWTLMYDYEQLQYSLMAIEEYFDVDSAYYQVDVDGVAYNIADPREPLFYIGTAEEPIEEFSGYPDNSEIPPVIYHSEFGWLCSVIKPILDPETGEAIAIAGVDVNMTDILRERYMFLRQSLIFVSFTKDDVIQLDIRSNDEVSDLYYEIQSMENRIVDYTDHLTRVTAEKERVSTELRTASQIQESMLPHIFPAFPDRDDFDLYASMTPAKEVGGDFYDFFLIDENHLALLIADVSDKGVPAALFMMSAKILINYRAQQGGSPSEILNAVNAQIWCLRTRTDWCSARWREPDTKIMRSE